MGQNQKTNKAAATARRLQSYAEALLGYGNGAAKSDDAQKCSGTDLQGMVLIMRNGDEVSYNCTTPDGHIEMGCYKQETPARSLVKCYVNNRDGVIELDGVRYFSPELITWYNHNVQAVRIGGILYIFDMSGKGVAEIKCDE